jgi:predicted secreted hydrolase
LVERRTGAADETATDGDASIHEQMAGAVESGFARATEPVPFTFPQDHGNHPDFRTEWWYLTGQLAATTDWDRAIGVQWTLFRSALTVDSPPAISSNPWRSRDGWMLHTAVSDPSRQRFFSHEGFARSGSAGATADPRPRIWFDDQVFAQQEDGSWRLTAELPEASYDLTLRPQRAPVLNGNRGLSQKGSQDGNASYYYSWPFLAAEGVVTINGEVVPVSGTLWLDREWSTSALEGDQNGWDWLAVHLDDGRSLMVYQLRDQVDRPSPTSTAVIAHPDGRVEQFSFGDFSMTPLRWWQSPISGRNWPVDWAIRIPNADIELKAITMLDAQEHQGLFPYWEGIVQIEDSLGKPAGKGYLELVGYGPADE